MFSLLQTKTMDNIYILRSNYGLDEEELLKKDKTSHGNTESCLFGEKFIVFQSCLLEIFKSCHVCQKEA